MNGGKFMIPKAVTSVALVTGALVVGVGSLATAQVYPSRPITMVVPFGTGGPTDTIGRLMAEGMRVPLGQPVIIENVVGGAGSVGIGRVARASPDGRSEHSGSAASCQEATAGFEKRKS